MNRVNILGTEYEILYRDKDKDELLSDMSGYCDKTSKQIVIENKPSDATISNWKWYSNKVLRHEIIHAFLIESGIQENYERCNMWGHDETMVDWLAIQFPKIQKVFEELQCL